MPTKGRECVVSKYVADPYLIEGRKFDIRVYVVVTGWDPVRVWVAGEGIVRFACELYSNSTAHRDIKRRLVHLTNYSVSKRARRQVEEVESHDVGADGEFSLRERKWSIATLRKYFKSKKNINFEPIWSQIHDIVIKTMMSVHVQNSSGVKMHVPNASSCYELFGFDILLDSQLKPWLLEVNISPSLKYSCEVDYQIKSVLCRDLLNLVGIRTADARALKSVMDAGARNGKKGRGSVGAGVQSAGGDRMRFRRREFTERWMEELTEWDLEVLRECEDEVGLSASRLSLGG